MSTEQLITNASEVFEMSQGIAKKKNLSPIEEFSFVGESIAFLLSAGEQELQAHVQQLLEPLQAAAKDQVKSEIQQIIDRGGDDVPEQLNQLSKKAQELGLFDVAEEIREEERAIIRPSADSDDYQQPSGCGGSSGCCG